MTWFKMLEEPGIVPGASSFVHGVNGKNNTLTKVHRYCARGDML
jgi:hypothetical protein